METLPKDYPRLFILNFKPTYVVINFFKTILGDGSASSVYNKSYSLLLFIPFFETGQKFKDVNVRIFKMLYYL